MNSAGLIMSAFGVVPAEQRFESLQPVIDQAIERLEMQLEIALVQRETQIEFKLPTLPRFFVEFRFEEVVRRFAFAFGAIERQIGILHQCRALGAIAWRDGDAEAAPYMEVVARRP